MAVTAGPESKQLFLGLSSDAKPGTAEFSAKFYEYDTGRTFIWTGPQPGTGNSPGQWVEYLPLWPALFGNDDILR